MRWFEGLVAGLEQVAMAFLLAMVAHPRLWYQPLKDTITPKAVIVTQGPKYYPAGCARSTWGSTHS